jgi:LysR family transcriptional activator of mexEF-oprN operon
MSALDLNLLLVFDAVMAERNFRRAAEKLGRTQPAISQAVARLRDVFGDPLFRKTPEGVDPTPRAEALWAELQAPIARIRAVAAPTAFDPARATGAITIGLSDDLELLALATIVARLRAQAPHLRINAIEADHQSASDLLQSGAADLCATVAETTRGVGREELFRQPFVLMHRRSSKPPDTLARYCAAEQVAVAFSAGAPGYTDRHLATLGKARKLIATTPRFAALPDLIAQTGALATLPGPVAHLLARRHRLATSPLPFALPPVAVCILWAQARAYDPMTVWLRTEVRHALLATRANVEQS